MCTFLNTVTFYIIIHEDFECRGNVSAVQSSVYNIVRFKKTNLSISLIYAYLIQNANTYIFISQKKAHMLNKHISSNHILKDNESNV